MLVCPKLIIMDSEINRHNPPEDFFNDPKLEEGIHDEKGVLYSKDGKILLSAEGHTNKSYLGDYIVKPGTEFIREGAFQFVNTLKSIQLPDSLISIGDYSFSECNPIKEISIPQNVSFIGDNAFGNFYDGISEFKSTIKKININNNIFEQKDGYLWVVSTKRLISCKSDSKEIKIPNDIKIIGDAVLCGMWSKDLIIPCNVHTIEENSFATCNISKLTIPSSVKSIGSFAFSYCSELEIVIFEGKGPINLGENIFKSCYNLKYIIVPSSSKEYYQSILPEYKDQIIYHDEISLSPEIVNQDLENIIIDENDVTYSNNRSALLRVGNRGKFHMHNIDWKDKNKEYKIKIGTHVICNNAFQNISNLKKVYLPDTIKVLGKDVFENCWDIEEIIIPDNSINRLGYNLYKYFDKIYHNWEIEYSLINIDIKKQEDEEGVIYDEKNNVIIEGGKRIFYNKHLIKRTTIPSYFKVKEGTLRINNSAFEGAENLKEIIIPDSVVTIGAHAFSRCINLKKVKISDSIQTIGKRGFYGCKSLESINLPNTLN